MRGSVKIISLLLVFVMLVLSILACEPDALEEQQKESVHARISNFERAESKYPIPQNQNFPIRELLVEYTKRQDMKNHPWYTYIMGDNGNITHYFVSTTMPVNNCAFLGSTESVRSSENGNLILTAPSLDGIYYGGAGASGGCNGWIFVDAATGAMGLAFGAKILTFDMPLYLEAEPVLIQPQASGQ